MKDFSPSHQDALVEICNVGMSKAAKQLSQLLDGSIDLSIPKIDFHTKKSYESENDSDEHIMSSVCQTLSDDLLGCTILMFDRRYSSSLVEAVIGKPVNMKADEVRVCEREAMLEIGNIIISSCLSAMVNMLNKSVELGLPSYGESTRSTLLKKQFEMIDEDEPRIFTISTRLQTSTQDFSGNLLLILSMKSIKVILEAIDEMLTA